MTPELLGELVYDTVSYAIPKLLDAELTASWEKGLTYVSQGVIGKDEYMKKLSEFVVRRTEGVKQIGSAAVLSPAYQKTLAAYRK